MHFYFICCHPSNLHGYLQVQLIEQVFSDVGKDLESVLWERGKYWQCQLFTNTHGMNILFDFYSKSGKVAAAGLEPTTT